MSLSNLSPLKQALLRIEELEARVQEDERFRREPIAVVGIGCRFPGGVEGPDTFWRMLSGGVDGTREVPPGRWDVDRYYDPDPEAPGKTYSRRGGYLDAVDLFDAPFFKISPREAAVMDPQQRLLLEVAWEALEHAGVPPRSLENSRTGVFAAISTNDYWTLQVRENDLRQIGAYNGSGIAYSVASGRLSYVFGLQGPSISIDTACSGSLVAVHLACQSLRAGECGMALAGGVNLILSPENSVIFAKAKMLAADGRCKTFDAAADGFAEGEGCGLVVLKRLSDAVAAGDRVLAVIRGSAVNQDGPSSGLTAPNGPSQEAVVRDALAAAGVKPAEVGYVEAHGTGTSLGDPIEVQALANVFEEGRSGKPPLWIGSVKTNIGHLEAAAGIAGLIKVVLALRHGTIPAHLHFRSPNPFIPWDRLAVAVPTTAVAWPAGCGRCVGGVSAFGFSGTNAHVVLESYSEPLAEPARTDRPAHILALSAAGPAALHDLAARHAAAAEERPDAGLADICRSANAGRSHEPHRLAIVASTSGELRRQLKAFVQGEKPKACTEGVAEAGERPRIAFLFAGQGAQYAGMGQALYRTQPVFREALDRCADVLGPLTGKPLLSILFPADDSAGLIHQTAYTQPALFALEWALSQLWQSWGVRPFAVLGHSLGEYVAAATAGVWSLEDGLAIVAGRARMMQELPSGGAMAAVFSDEARVAAALRGRAGVVIAAVNGPRNVVISGDGDGVRSTVAELNSAGIETQPLTVSHAFHSPLMEPVLERFEASVRQRPFAPAAIPLASNLYGRIVRGDHALDGSYWRRHMREPVRFADGIQALRSAGVTVFLEIGPGSTLTGMGRRVPGADGAVWLSSLERRRDDWAGILATLADLYCRGVEIDWEGFDRPYRRARVDVPTYPFQRQSHWFHKPAAGIAAPPARPQGRPQGHPLVQRRLPTAIGIFESDLCPESLPWLGDHRVHGRILLPATAYLEAARAASAAVLGRDLLSLEDVVIGEPLAWAEGESRRLQIVVAPGASGEVSFSIYSAAGADSWRMHASGRATPQLPVAAASGAGEGGECTESRDAAEHYRSLAARGVELGGWFRGVSSLHCGAGEAVGELLLSGEAGSDASGYGVHPALLDAALQVVGASFPAGAGLQGTYLPLGFDRVDFHAFPRGPAGRSHARLRPVSQPDAEVLTADVRMFDEAGRLLVAVSGLRLKRLTSEARTAGGTEEWMYEVRWREQALEASGRDPADLDALNDALRQAAPPADEAAISRYEELVARLEAMSGAWVARALNELGCRPAAGQLLTPSELAGRLGVLERHRRLFDRMLAILGEDGYLEAEGAAWRVRQDLDICGDPWPDLQNLLARYPEYEAEVSLLGRCGPRLADALRGRVDPLDLLFPGGDTSTAERLYEQSPLAQAYNGLVRTAVVAAAARLKTGQNLRILEVGGGTGGTTSGLLAALPPDRTDYVFTDISQHFVARAAGRFGTYPFVQYRTLDIEQDPLVQGFQGGRFDIVVAANVLHATRNLRDTLTHVGALLAPGGVLVALEMVAAQRDVDLVFGLTDGWWRFADTEWRSESPLMSSRKWRDLLDKVGFRESFAFPDHAEVRSRAANQVVLVAGKPASTGAVPDAGSAAWLIFENGSGEGRELTRRIAAGGAQVIRVSPGAAFARIEDGHFAVNPAGEGDFRRLREEAFGSRRCLGIVHLWSLDASSEADWDDDALEAAQLPGVRSVLGLVQAFGDALADPARLSLVTRGAQASGAEPGLRPWQAPVWGLAKVVALEHPELRCLRIDLDPAGGPGEIEQVAAELLANGGEDQVMLRGNRRYVARLVRAEAPPVCPPAPQPVRFEVGIRGELDSVVARPVTRRTPEAGEVEIRVAATGLNLRDVLGAMGLYPGDPGPLGSECAGVVTAVGPGVRDLTVNDEVLAVAPGCLATYVTAPAAFVMRRPPNLTMEQAASVAIPYITACFALLSVARLRAGERVLIHAAAGGVGLAAVHLARRAGAEVMATAGNEEKRDFLRSSLGIATVLDSRSTEFAAAIVEKTGGRGVDVVLNSLGPEFVGPGLSVLAPGGRFIELAKTGILDAGQIAALPADIEYHVVDWSEQARQTPEQIRSILKDMLALLAAGELPPLPVRTFPAAEPVPALRFMGNARHIGKLVLVHDGPERERPLLRPDSTYVITGGLRGLGLLVARRFVALGARHLLLIGRAEPSPAAAEVIAGLQAAGARVVAARADVSRSSEVARELERAEALLPPIAGVIHAAGVLRDSTLRRLDWARLAEVLAPKLRGAWNLFRCLRHRPLDFFVSFSSIASLFGSPGQASHAAANAFLDAFAWFLRASGVPGQAIQWGAWAEVGAAAERNVGGRIVSRGIATIAPQQGLDALEAVMRSRHAQVAVTPMQWHLFLESFGSGAVPPFLSVMSSESRSVPAAPAAPATKAAAPIWDRLAQAPAGKRHRLLVGYVSEKLARVLGLGAGEAIDERLPLTDMGLDSLMAVELRNLIGAGLRLERGLPATVVYDYPTVREMAAYLESQLPFAEAGGAAGLRQEPAAKRSDVAALDNIEQLSDEEVERLFAARVASGEPQ